MKTTVTGKLIKERVICPICRQSFRPASIRNGNTDSPRKHNVRIVTGRGVNQKIEKILCPGSHKKASK